MENESTTEFRPLILVAEDDDSNFKLIKAIIGKKYFKILWQLVSFYLYRLITVIHLFPTETYDLLSSD